MKKFLAVAITLLFFGMIIFPSSGIQIDNTIVIPTNRGNTLYVGGSGGNNYTTIQSAIDDASNGDIVFVYSSIYYENVRIIEKSIELIGEDKNTTVIDGNYTDYPIYMSSTNDVKISGFTLINPQSIHYDSWRSVLIKIIDCHNSIIENNIVKQNNVEFAQWNAGIYLLNSKNNSIRNNIILNSKVGGKSVGIMLYDSSKLNNLSNNEIYNFTEGISFYSYDYHDADDNTIYGNYIYHNCDGIDIVGGNGNKIIKNIITSNRYNGIELRVGNNTFISENVISKNGIGGGYDSGIFIIGYNNYIINNYISNNNPTGIQLSCANNLIIHNNITNNLQIGVYGWFSEENSVLHNNFIDNGNYNAYFEQLIEDRFSIKWNKNYWSNNNGKSYYKIPGYVYVAYIFGIGFTWFNYDWNPASQPYNIPGKSSYVGCGIE